MTHPSTLQFLASRGLTSIAAWCRLADINPDTAYLARHGRQRLTDQQIERLARVVGESPATAATIFYLGAKGAPR